jgi:hypothetical protein
MTTIPLTIQLPIEVALQIDARLPPGGAMQREELASLLITLGLISSRQVEVLTAEQTTERRSQAVAQAKTGLMSNLRSYLSKLRSRPAIGDLPMDTLLAMETVIGAAMGTGWSAAAHAVQHGVNPADILAACQAIGEECDYNIEVL